MCIIMEAECPADGVAKGNFALEYAGNSVDFQALSVAPSAPRD